MTLRDSILAHPHLLIDEETSRYDHLSDRPGLCVGFVPGVMPGKWFGRWKERYSALTPLAEVALGEGMGLAALDAYADMVMLRPEDEPEALNKKKYHAIELYREQLVLVLPKDHLLTLLEEVPVEELAQEFLLQDPEEVPAWAELSAGYRAENPRPLPAMRHRKDAVELVAAGLGLLIVPLSLARFYHRKDLVHRPVTGLDGDTTPELGASAAERPVLLVWKKEAREEEREAVLQDFVGITRGRTAASQRGTDSKEAALEKQRRLKEEEKRKRQSANRKRETEDRKKRNARKNGNLRQYQAQKGQAKTQAKGHGKKR